MALETAPKSDKSSVEVAPGGGVEITKILESIDRAMPGITFKPEVISRLALLERNSKFNLDSRMIEAGMKNVLAKIAQEDARYGITAERMAEARLASLIHDIGKSGPVGATEDQQLAVVRLFAREELRSPEQMVPEAVVESFGEESNLIIYNLKSCIPDLDNMTMLKFWQSHARWGYEIIQAQCADLPLSVREIAIQHHADKGPDFNFLNMSMEQIPKESLALGAMENYVDVLRQRAIIAMDQYEAQIRRAQVTHEEAIEWVRRNVGGAFGQDAFMNKVLDTMLAMKQEEIFNGIIE